MSQPVLVRTDTENRSTDATEVGNRPRNAITCPRCDAWWTGLTAGHCTGCHRSFTGIAAFDRHRSGSHAADTRHCLDPATVLNEKGEPALVPANKPWTGWSLPGTWEGPDE
jgi:hypothetical protein